MSVDPDDQFDWTDPDTVIIPEQSAIAVYVNGSDGVVIRQQGDMYDSDAFVVIQPNNLRIVIQHLIKLCRDLEAKR